MFQVERLIPFDTAQVRDFLALCGLRADIGLDAYYAVMDGDRIVAGAGISGHVLKCVAVLEEYRGEGLLNMLVSHIMSLHGHELKVFTKPENEKLFRDLGFRALASCALAVFMENGEGLGKYCSYLSKAVRPGRRSGFIIMNANPFTLGHRYLVTSALESVDVLYIIPVAEEASLFPYRERKAMIEEAVKDLQRVVVLDGSPYQISADIFPTYFLKDLSDAAPTQMSLDADLFARHIAPALGASIRFVGTEPLSPLMQEYNGLLKKILPSYGVEVLELPRLCGEDGACISASAVRDSLSKGHFADASRLTPPSSWPFLLGFLASRALGMELDTPLKPGLVCPESRGAHADMDYALMKRGIAAIRPFWPLMAMAGSVEELRQLGIEAEEAMMEATGGVNTHRGAIFALGLAANCCINGGVTPAMLQETASMLYPAGKQGAVDMALGGYGMLFRDWLPYYRSLEGNEYRNQLTLLRIMGTLEDTCIIHRAGEERAAGVRREAAGLLSAFSPEKLRDLCLEYASKGISPGGAADMLSLTIFIDSLTI